MNEKEIMNEEFDNDLLQSIDRALEETKRSNQDEDRSLFSEATKIDYNNFETKEFSKIATEKQEKTIEKVDISKLTVVAKNELEKSEDLKKALYGNMSSYQIVAAQSGYMAKVSSLVNKDTVSLLYNNSDQFQYKKSVYQTVWEKIYETSIGKLDFNTWLSLTSAEDLETFMYGIYCATFPNEGEFTFTCPHCQAESEYMINSRTLIQTADSKKMKNLISRITKESNSLEKAREFSLVGRSDAFKLPDSGIVIQSRTPSLHDLLSILKDIPARTLERKKNSISYVVYTEKALVPSANGTYIEVSDKEELIQMVDNLSIDDAKLYKETILEKINENRITYSIKNLKCPMCGEVEKEIPISIEDILFTQIFERTQ